MRDIKVGRASWKKGFNSPMVAFALWRTEAFSKGHASTTSSEREMRCRWEDKVQRTSLLFVLPFGSCWNMAEQIRDASARRTMAIERRSVGKADRGETWKIGKKFVWVPWMPFSRISRCSGIWNESINHWMEARSVVGSIAQQWSSTPDLDHDGFSFL